ncbi:hypothetical protein BXT86_05850 [candidate division WOR-3 bacterium 4484_100]|uniref:UPF0235 protein BXT86_05850 n=1 Tax=candidate division WOR-3 bacterium 4484_100 TaxID=1936077 RepID=A0A1V4QF99_UNCW3|nr:MAG: hypothetical protein BXT86_05850 [candidate division WOR-3 bacterium 4484_100]
MKKIRIKVITRAKKQEVIQLKDDYYKVKLTSPPVRGQANRELISLLARYFKVKKSSIELVRGLHSKEKLVIVRPSAL